MGSDYYTEEGREKVSRAQKREWAEHKEERLAFLRSPAMRERVSEVQKKAWADPDKRAARIAAIKAGHAKRKK